MSKVTIQPTGGYKYPQKDRAREILYYNAFLGMSVMERYNAIVMILPSELGLDFPILLALGIREENIIAVDFNPAVFKKPWVKAYPRVRKWCMDIKDAPARLLAEGIKLTFANLDTCGAQSRKTALTLIEWRGKSIWAPGARVSATISNRWKPPVHTRRWSAEKEASHGSKAIWCMNLIAGIDGHELRVDSNYKQPGKHHRMFWALSDLK